MASFCTLFPSAHTGHRLLGLATVLFSKTCLGQIALRLCGVNDRGPLKLQMSRDGKEREGGERKHFQTTARR